MYFRNEYYFLSNMYPCKIKLTRKKDNKEFVFGSVECAFQACKEPSKMELFVGLNGYDAKKLGRKVNLPNNWNKVKVDIMEMLLRKKFEDESLMKLLLNVRGEIVEDNTWNDYYWGKCNGKGSNVLGNLLMKIRDTQ